MPDKRKMPAARMFETGKQTHVTGCQEPELLSVSELLRELLRELIRVLAVVAWMDLAVCLKVFSTEGRPARHQGD